MTRAPDSPASTAPLIERLTADPERPDGTRQTPIGRLAWAPDTIAMAPRATADAERFEPIELTSETIAALRIARGVHREPRWWLPRLLGVQERIAPCVFIEVDGTDGQTLRLCAEVAAASELEGLPTRTVYDAHVVPLEDLVAVARCAHQLGAAVDVTSGPEPGERSDKELAEEAAALDPHAVGAVHAPDWPQHPAELVTRNLGLKWLDYLVYQVEKVIVVYMLAMMSVAMFLDMFYLSLVKTDQSNLANFIMRVGGIEPGTATAANLTATVILVELVAFVLLAYLAATTRMRDSDVLTRLAVAAWAVTGCLGLAWLVRNEPTHVTFQVLLAGSVVGTGALWWMARSALSDLDPRDEHDRIALVTRTRVARERLAVFVAMVLAWPVLAWLMADLPDNFSFAQRRSLFWLLWVGFLGASMATYQRAHLRIDFVRKLVKGRRAGHIYSFFSLLVTLMFTGVFLYIAWDYMFHPDTGAYYKETPEGLIPDWQKVGVIPLALAIMCARFAMQAVESLVGALRGGAGDDDTAAHASASTTTQEA